MNVAAQPRDWRITVLLEDDVEEASYVYDLVHSGRLQANDREQLPLPFRGQFLFRIPDSVRPLPIQVGRFEPTATEVVAGVTGLRLVVTCAKGPPELLTALETALRDVPSVSADEIKTNLTERLDEFGKVQQMTFAQRMIYATRAGQSGRAVLMQQPSPLLLLYLCKNPLIQLPEVIHIAKLPSIDALVAEYIAKMMRANPEWAMNDELKVALIGNAKTPVGTALALIKLVSSRSLRQLTKRGELRATVRQAALKTLIDRRD